MDRPIDGASDTPFPGSAVRRIAGALPEETGTAPSDGSASKRELGTVIRSDAVRHGALVARRFARDARGATSIEYALIAGLIFMITVGSIRLYSSKMNTVYGQITGSMSQIN